MQHSPFLYSKSEWENKVRITFQTGDVPEGGRQYGEKQAVRGEDAGRNVDAGRTGAAQNRGSAYQVDFLSRKEKGWIPGSSMGREKGKSLIELQQEAGNIDVGIQRDYMTVMSNTLSKEDYAKLSEEGFHFDNIDPEEAVTIVDKIKAELARSGQIIVGYTDDLDLDTLAAAVGSDTLARAVADSFRQADIPLTEANLDQVQRAWDMASGLTQPTEGAYQYMVDNEMQPEIWDFYLAENSGAQAAAGVPAYYAEDIQGYYTQSADTAVEGRLQEQIDKVIEQAGFPVDEESRQSASWLMERGLPLTAENLERLADLQKVAFPVTEEVFAQAAAHAIAEGKNPVHGDLSKTDGSANLYQKAADVLAHYQTEVDWESLGGDLTARRQLEEIRLRMTAEVNVRLLKSGFAIDTAPMEQLLEALKQAESQVAEDYFPKDPQAVEKYRAYHQTNQILEELPAMPARILGDYAAGGETPTLSGFYRQGQQLQEDYRKANESYEALMTAPRSDLGDSIRKAFANVDDIVKDLGFVLTEENRRAVRILGYNRMEMTVENVEKVREADRQVQKMIHKMTPASTLKMIREGINPLEKSFEELETYFDQTEAEYEESAESYSRFLYGLERRNAITEEERAAYIGIYRMLHQIQSSDGAVVGALVNSQAQIQFSNLLSAVRTGKFKHMDVKVEDALGTVESVIRSGESITDQIARGFVEQVENILTEVSYSQEAQAAYEEEALSQIRQAALTENDAIALLERGEVPANAGNLLAAQELLQAESNLFEEIADRWKDRDRRQTYENLLGNLENKDIFRETYEQTLDTLQEEVQDESLNQADTSVDVRSLRMVNKQLSIAAGLASSEEYILPMYIGENLTKVHLTIERGSAEKGGVHIAVTLPQGGQVEAHFTLEKGTLRGFLAGNTEEEVTKLKRAADIFSDYISEGREGLQDISLKELPVIGKEAVGAFGDRIGTEADSTQTDGAENIELYHIAKVFLQAVQEEEVAYEN